MILNANSVHIPMADQSVQMCVTSPPYYGLRSYSLEGTDWDAVTYTPMAGLPALTVDPWRGCLGLEPTPEMFVAHIAAVFREVWRVLRDDGTCWLNFGDSYNGSGKGIPVSDKSKLQAGNRGANLGRLSDVSSLKPKDLMGIPWRVAFALQADGWYLRNDIIWHKPNPMPESVTDRCTKAHEYLFLLAKSQRYFYDNEAVKEGMAEYEVKRRTREYKQGLDTKHLVADAPGQSPQSEGGAIKNIKARQELMMTGKRNRRTVWTINTHPYKGAHFATYPVELVAPCVLAGTSAKGVCPICGAPWERVVEKGFAKHTGVTGTQYGPGSTAGRLALLRQAARENGVEYANTAITTGWQPTCEHDAEPIPAKVLDPFCGSGTTGVVCNETGRKFVGLDMSMEYLRNLALPRAESKQTQASIQAMPLFENTTSQT